MSHFTVLVPATDSDQLEKILLPYHEYECTGFEEYVQFVEVDMAEAQEKYAEYGKDTTFGDFVADWYGASKNDQGVWGRFTNPNKKWDWWVVGGRWSGTLLLKPEFSGKSCDTALAHQIDWEKLRQNQIEDAKRRYTSWQKLSDEDRHHPGKLLDIGMFTLREGEREDLDTGSLENYLEKYGRLDALTFAFIDLAGQWHERASMGWFATTSNPNDNYTQEWWEFINTLPTDQRVYVVDCHI